MIFLKIYRANMITKKEKLFLKKQRKNNCQNLKTLVDFFLVILFTFLKKSSVRYMIFWAAPAHLMDVFG